MKRNAPYTPSIKSTPPPAGLVFRIATPIDREPVTQIMSERNPENSFEELLKKTDREISLNSSDPKYRLFVAALDGKVVGLCRYFHSDGLPKEKLIYPAPSGWYCMGIVVDRDFRRRGIARFLFKHRLEALKAREAETVYSMVDTDNLSSVAMHQSFGFEQIEEAPGFLHIKFDSVTGILYRMRLT